MKFSLHSKHIMGVLTVLIISTVIFATGKFLCTDSAGVCREKLACPKNSELQNFVKSEVSAAQILAEMQAANFLKKNFRQWFVSPEGNAAANGTIAAPLDLATAFSSKIIKAGDIVWLRGGNYQGSFAVRISGEKDAPIHFRQYPKERAVIDKAGAKRDAGALDVRSSYVWFWDFEVANSFPNRSSQDSDDELNPWRGSGVNVYAPNTKYINLIVRDNGHGFGLWNEEGGTEIYGCLIFNNGNNKKEHGVYAHNRNGVQLISSNLIFNNAGYGLHVYANSVKSAVSGFEISENTVFNNGAIAPPDQVADQILVGGVEAVSSARIVLRDNFIYTSPELPTAKNRGVRLGYRDKNNQDAKILNNFIVSKIPLKILWWQTIEARNNTLVSADKSVAIETPADADSLDYKFDANNYLTKEKSGNVFTYNEEKVNFRSWQSINKFDLSARIEATDSASMQTVKTFLRLNKYDQRRGDLVIYNPQKTSKIKINIQQFLRAGDVYEIRDAQNFFGAAVLSGTFDGKEITLSLDQKTVTLPMGETAQKPIHTTADFAVFVIVKAV